MTSFKEIIKNFPKKRIKLSDRYLKIYKQHYKDNREGKGLFNYLSSYLESWAHKIIIKNDYRNDKILEIGGGTLNHLMYENNFKTYDVVEPFKELYKDSIYKKKIKNFYSSIFKINKKKKYDRIISIMSFEHITNLPDVVARCNNLLNKNGVMQVAIPCEGEKAFELGWRFSTAISFKHKYHLDYSKIMQHEHINTKAEIEIILKNFFKIKKFIRSPIFLPIKNFSFYCFFECVKK